MDQVNTALRCAFTPHCLYESVQLKVRLLLDDNVRDDLRVTFADTINNGATLIGVPQPKAHFMLYFSMTRKRTS